MRCAATVFFIVALSTQSMAWERSGYYRSVDGSMVHVPYHTREHMAGEMAICRDGTH